MTVLAKRLDSKTPTEVIDIEVDFRELLSTLWTSGTQKSVGDFVRPTARPGFEYEATAVASPGVIGQTGVDEPIWPTVVGQTITDESITWTCRAFGTNASDTISGQSASTKSGLTLGAASVSGTTVTFRASIGVNGKDYDIVVQITTAAGQTIEQTVTLPIRYHRLCG